MRGIRIKDRRRLVTDANITPLVDACLVLLVIFMISSPFIINQVVNISLPKTLSAAEMKQGDELSIYAVFEKSSGKTVYSIGDKKSVTIAEIKASLEQSLKDRSNRTVRIFSDGNVPMKRVIELTDMILSSGGKIQIITEYGEPDEQNPKK